MQWLTWPLAAVVGVSLALAAAFAAYLFYRLERRTLREDRRASEVWRRERRQWDG